MGLFDLAKTVDLGRSGPKAELTNYIPTNQEWLGRIRGRQLSEGAYGVFSRKSLWAQMGLARTSASVPDITPLGASFALEKAGNAALEGNYSEALLDAFGAIPGERLAAFGLKGTGKAAKQWGEKLSSGRGTYSRGRCRNPPTPQGLARFAFQPVPRSSAHWTMQCSGQCLPEIRCESNMRELQ